MNADEKQFAVDLMRALDEGMGNDSRKNDDEYYKAQYEGCRGEIKRTVKKLIELGYKKCLS